MTGRTAEHARARAHRLRRQLDRMRHAQRLLAEHGVNLESLTTEVAPAPMSSEPLFHATALLAVPLDLSLDQLQDKLETLADDLMVELNLRSDE